MARRIGLFTRTNRITQQSKTAGGDECLAHKPQQRWAVVAAKSSTGIYVVCDRSPKLKTSVAGAQTWQNRCWCGVVWCSGVIWGKISADTSPNGAWDSTTLRETCSS